MYIEINNNKKTSPNFIKICSLLTGDQIKLLSDSDEPGVFLLLFLYNIGELNTALTYYTICSVTITVPSKDRNKTCRILHT
jgi:hypothetical protein